RFSRDWSSDVCSSDLRGGHQSGAVPYGIIELITNAAAAVTGTFERTLHMHLRNQLGTRLAGPEIRLAQQIGDVGSMQRQPVLMEIGRASCRERVRIAG